MAETITDTTRFNVDRVELYLPHAHSTEFLHDHVYDLLEGTQEVARVVHDELTIGDRIELMKATDVIDEVFHDPYFATNLFPMFVDYVSTDHFPALQQKTTEVCENRSTWLAGCLQSSHLGLYQMVKDEAHPTLLARCLLTGIDVPLHVSALNNAVREGDFIAARIYQTPYLNAVITLFALRKVDALKVATELTLQRALTDDTIDTFMKKKGAILLLKELVAVTKTLLMSERNETTQGHHDATERMWSSLIGNLPARAIELDGIGSDGALFHLKVTEEKIAILYRFEDVNARSAVLIGGSFRETKGFLRMTEIDQFQVSAVGRNLKPKATTDSDLERAQTTLFGRVNL